MSHQPQPLCPECGSKLEPTNDATSAVFDADFGCPSCRRVFTADEVKEPAPAAAQPEPLTRAAILKLEGRELELAVARALGWPEIDEDEPFRLHRKKGGVIVNGHPGKFRGSVIPDFGWHPATDWNAAGELLEEAKRENIQAFATAVQQVTNLRTFGWYAGSGEAVSLEWLLFLLSPVVIARAFLFWKLNPQA